jgi:hypothetical protein
MIRETHGCSYRLRPDTKQSSGFRGLYLFHLTAALDKSGDIPRCASCFSNGADEFAAAADISMAGSHPSLGSI